MKRRLRLLISAWYWYIGYSACGRCHLSMRFLEDFHTTWFLPGRGVGVLCEHCWRQLGQPKARLPYYQRLMTEWTDTSNWPYIENAVVNGG